jgi:GW (Gly-Tryp) dipeptide domain
MLQLLKNYSLFFSFCTALCLGACEQSTTLEEVKPSAKNSVFKGGQEGVINEKQVVKILEHLPGKRYSYAKVQSGTSIYWLATMLGDFHVGKEYYYTEGLEKTSYQSTELNRTFDRIILVTQLFSKSNAAPVSISNQGPVQLKSGSLTIKEIVAKATQFRNKTVQVTARVIKVNASIMDRNWYHLQDGSLNGYDFVATSTEEFPLGHVVTFKGTLILNKDFGAGYSYEILLENAKAV